MKFKIKTEDVRKALKKTKIPLEDGNYISTDLDQCKITGACAISQVYLSKHKQEYNDTLGNVISEWANKKLGRLYKLGFTNGFDGVEFTADAYYCKNKKQKLIYNTGYQNGKLLRRTLLNK